MPAMRQQRFTRTLRKLTKVYSGYQAFFGERLPETLAELVNRLQAAPPKEFVIGTLSQLIWAGASARERRHALFVL